MSARAGAAAPRRPGRPSTGARERILDAGLEVLKSDGYAGLTIAKVAARAGQNKALISYHFGSKQGLIAAAARSLGETITTEVLAGIGDAETVDEVVAGVVAGTWAVLERDERIARVYFDLSAVSVVEDDVRAVLHEVKDQWRRVLIELLREAGIPPSTANTGALMVLAGNQGLCLEWIERGDTPELSRARDMLVRATAAAIAS